MSDTVLFVAVVVSFAVWVTAHVAIVYGLASRAPRWRALVALLVAPLAPFWAVRERMLFRAGLWIMALLVYVLARLLERS